MLRDQNPWLVSFCIYNAEEAEGLVKRVGQPVRGIWRYIENIKKIQGILSFVDEHLSPSSDADDDMFMAVLFKTAVTPG